MINVLSTVASKLRSTFTALWEPTVPRPVSCSLSQELVKQQRMTEEGMLSEQPVRPKVIDDHIVKAKKEWQCSACGEAIFKTQKHRRIIWRDGGIKRHDLGGKGFHCDHVHLRCWPREGVAST